MRLLLFLFLFVVIQLIRCQNREDFFFISSLSPIPPLSSTSVSFLTKNELYNTLISNDDKFFDTFFDYDMKARQIQSITQYAPMIKSAVNFFSETEKAKIQKCTKLCDDYLMTIHDISGFDGVKASNIPWIIGKISGISYEYGLPHTRQNSIIVLPNKNINDNDSELTRTLIHEKIHLYQKIYSSDIEVYLEQHNMVRIKKREYDDYIRANPDLDDWIYKDKITGFIYKCEYSSKEPQNILDVKNTNQLFEHPFEKMAVEISQKLFI